MEFDISGLMGPQPVHAVRLANSLLSNGVAWDGSDTGTGKTYTTCAILRNLKRKFVIICPKLARPQWVEVLAKFGLQAEFIINYEKLSRGNTSVYKHITAAKYRELHGIDPSVVLDPHRCSIFKIPKDRVIILDESHKCKGIESLNSGLMVNLSIQKYTVLLLSATQAATPLDMRAFGYLMGLHDFSMHDFKRFAEASGAEWVGRWGAMFFDTDKPESMAKLAEVRKNLFDDRCIGARMRKADFDGVFPKSQVVAEAYDMGTASDKIQEAYNEMEVELDRLEEQSKNYKEHALAIITKARRLAELYKVPTMVQMANDFHTEGRSTVIFVNYTETIEAIHRRLVADHGDNKVGLIYGGRKEWEKNRDIAEFQQDKRVFMVANLASGGQSINLHDVMGGRPRSSLVNPSYSALNVIQSLGRIDRAYAQSDVYQRFLYAARTIESSVVTRFHHKHTFVTALNDGTLTDADLIPTKRLFALARGMNV